MKTNVVKAPLAGQTHTRQTWRQVGLGIILALLGTVIGEAALPTVLETATNSANGHVYFLLSASTWTDAEARAVQLGGHLATINDASENQWVFDRWGTNRNLWIGFSDAAVEGHFVWSSGEAATYTNWRPGEPSNTGDEDYTHIIAKGLVSMTDGLWNDAQNVLVAGPYSMYGVVEIGTNSTVMTNAGLAVLETATNSANGHVYHLLAPSTWTDAEARAIELGGHLATINDASENQWVFDRWGTNRNLWIGFSDAAVEGHFVWSSGEPATYTNWRPGEPSNTGDEDYAHIIAKGLVSMTDGLWNDAQNVTTVGPYPMYGVVEIGTNSTVVTNAGLAVLETATNSANRHVYFLLSASTWTDAETRAIELGGHLATINDASENQWVFDRWGTNRNLWIGFSDAAVEGQFVWSSGEAATYTNWRPGEPSNTGDEDYTHIIAKGLVSMTQGLWNDAQNVLAVGPYPMYGVVEVVPTNNPPVADAQVLQVNEDEQVEITLTGTDPDGNPLTFQLVSSPRHGVLSGSAPELIYRPNTNFNGSDEFSFMVSDGISMSAPALVRIEVVPVNDAPVAFGQALMLNEDTAMAVTLEATDADGDALSYHAGTPLHGTLSGTAPDLVYMPTANYHGTDSFTFRVSDGIAWSEAATVSLTILPVNDPPVAVAQVFSPTMLMSNMTNIVIVSPNNSNATVILDGSLSTDVDGDALRYYWCANGASNAFASGIRVTNTLPMGSCAMTLGVYDGTAMGTTMVRFEVISASEAAADLYQQLTDASLARTEKRPLLAMLRVVMEEFEKGQWEQALKHLEDFQHKLGTHVEKADVALAQQLRDAAQAILDALEGLGKKK